MIWCQDPCIAPLCERILICSMMNPEKIYYSLEVGFKGKQEDYIWPVAGEATVNDKVFIICAGAGSVHNEDTASKLTCQFMSAKVSKFGEQEMSGELIDKLLIEARERLISYARIYRLDTDLPSTFSMLILYDHRVFMSWYGDGRIYHLRDGEILFSTGDNSSGNEPIQNTAILRGINADTLPICTDTKWIEDVQDGDYFFLCSKGIIENVTDSDIKLLISQDETENIDLTGSIRRLAFEKTLVNYSMYLIRVKVDTQKKGTNNGNGFSGIKKQTSGIVSPIFILVMTLVGLLIMVIYFRATRKSIPRAIVTSTPRSQPANVVHEDSVPNAIVMSVPRKQILKVTDSVKNNKEKPIVIPPDDNSAVIQPEEKPVQKEIQTPIAQKKQVGQLMIKLTTDESCKLKITNLDLDEVFDWDLSPNDNGAIFLKPGKYSIVATSMISSSKTKTYNFDVKPGSKRAIQNIHIKF